MSKRGWSCRKCSYLNEPAHRRCRGCENARPKKRVPKHMEALRDYSYEDYVALNWKIHRLHDQSKLELDPESCGVCNRAKPETRRHDRDHDHRTGKPRGLACVRCNRELLRNTTLEEARLVVAYLERVNAYYS